MNLKWVEWEFKTTMSLTVKEWIALTLSSQVWETQRRRSGEPLLLSKHRTQDAATLHHLSEGLEGNRSEHWDAKPKQRRLHWIQLNNQNDKTRRQDFPQFLKRKRNKATWVVWFVFTQLVLHRIFFVLFSTHEELMSCFLNAVIIKKHTYMNVRMRRAINQHTEIWKHSLQLSSILCCFFFYYNPHSHFLIVCFERFFFFLRSLDFCKPQHYRHKHYDFILTNFTVLFKRDLCVCATGTERSDVESSAYLRRALQDPLPWAPDAAVEERNVLVKLCSRLFHWFLLKFVFPLWF